MESDKYERMKNGKKRVENNMIRNAKKDGLSCYMMYRAIKTGVVNVNPSIMDWMDSGFGDGGFYITWKDGWTRTDLFSSVKLKDKEKYLRYRRNVDGMV